MTRVWLDLFSGKEGFSAAAKEADGWEVVTVDNNPDFDPDVCADILDLHWSDLPRAHVVTAGPPCPAFSVGGNHAHIDTDGIAISDFGKESLLLANYGRGLAAALTDAWYIVENPMGGLRSFWGEPDYHVWYCQYGHNAAKPTDLWGRLPDTFTPRSCANSSPFCDHDRATRGTNHSGTQDSSLTPAERAKVPYELSKAILEAVEAAGRSIQDDTEQSALADGGLVLGEEVRGGQP